MARRILLSQEDSNALNMQDSEEGSNNLAEGVRGVRGEIFSGIVESLEANLVLNVVYMQDSEEGSNNNLAEGVRGEIFGGIVESLEANLVLNVASCKFSLEFFFGGLKFYFRIMEKSTTKYEDPVDCF